MNFDERNKRVYESRVLHKKKLWVIAKEFGVTQERVRQIVTKEEGRRQRAIAKAELAIQDATMWLYKYL